MKRVLIVDDDRLIRTMLHHLLTADAMKADDAIDGSECLAKAEADRPDIILLDLMMPGMNGYDVCRALKLKPETREIPVVFLTASSDPKLNRRAFAAGAVACIPKPLKQDSLKNLIAMVLAQPNLAGSAIPG